MYSLELITVGFSYGLTVAYVTDRPIDNKLIYDFLTTGDHKMETLKFNTGRLYTEAGQRIAAGLLDNGDIVFIDIDRDIDGLITADGMTKEQVKSRHLFSARDVMYAYDANIYKSFYLDDDFATVRELRQLAETVPAIKQGT